MEEDLKEFVGFYDNDELEIVISKRLISKKMVNIGEIQFAEPDWENKSKGRSADSVINTSLVHLYRYAKLYSKAAIVDTSFSTPDDFIYLLSLVSKGSMTKSALIRHNVHEKSPGMQIVNRLIGNGFVEQYAMENNKKSQMISITALGKKVLEDSMTNVKTASNNVTEPLVEDEKLLLISLLQKLELFHEAKLSKNLIPTLS